MIYFSPFRPNMATSLQQAQTARDDKQAEVDDCNAALDTAKGNVLLAYTLALNQTQDDLDAFCLQVLQTYPAAQSSQVNAEQVYINAYVALQEVQDELQGAQTLVAQLSSNAGATNADVIQAIERLFQFVNTKFEVMEARITSIQAEQERLRRIQVSECCWVHTMIVLYSDFTM